LFNRSHACLRKQLTRVFRVADVFVDRLFEAEKTLREVATSIQLVTSPQSTATPLDVARTARNVVRRLHEVTDSLANLKDRLKDKSIFSVAVPAGSDVVEVLVDSLTLIRIASVGISPDNPDEDLPERVGIAGLAVSDFEARLDSLVKRITGERCIYLYERKPSAILNNVAACLHRLAEYFSRTTVTRGKCNVVTGSSEVAVRFCELWDSLTERFNALGLYGERDYAALKAWIYNDRVYLRVGSAQGHRTEVDFTSPGGVRYYDEDRDVNRIVARLLGKCGLSCTDLKDGVICKGNVASSYACVAKALAQATSMDLRLNDPQEFIKNEKVADALLRRIARSI